MTRGPVLSICHGGGPLPILNDPAHHSLIQSLKTRCPSLLHLKTSDKPRAILLVTAHWETTVTTISNAAKHSLLYDYGGFPRQAYELTYDAPGDPDIAQLVSKRLAEAGVKTKMDSRRGWDHGVFVPMTLINPAADIPIIQMSVLASQSAEDLYKVGQALKPLRDENIAIVGSGSASFHNLRGWFTGGTRSPEFRARHASWEAGIRDAVSERDEVKRGHKLQAWRQLPHASEMHPPMAAEHFSPLVVCAGAAGDQEASSWSNELMGVDMRSYYWT